MEIEFSGFTAAYVKERVWSSDQKITELDDEKIQITFSASSENELVGWILSWSVYAKVLKPDWLIGRVTEKLDRMRRYYS